MDEQQDRMQELISTTLKAEVKDELTGDNETASPNEANTYWIGRPPKLFNEVYTNLKKTFQVSRMNHGKISPSPWLTSLQVSWISHILLKKSIFKSGEPIKALNKTRTIQTKTNKVQSRYLPSLLTGASPKSEIQFENDIFLLEPIYLPITAPLPLLQKWTIFKNWMKC